MRVYLDSMVWIYFLEGNPAFFADATTLMHRLRDGKHTTLSSFLVEAELLVLPKRKGDRFTEASYKRIFSSPEVISIPYPPPSPDIYAELRAKHVPDPLIRFTPHLPPLRIPIYWLQKTRSFSWQQSPASGGS